MRSITKAKGHLFATVASGCSVGGPQRALLMLIAKIGYLVVWEFKGRFRLIDFAILDGYRTGLRHNPEGNLLPFQREFGVL